MDCAAAECGYMFGHIDGHVHGRYVGLALTVIKLACIVVSNLSAKLRVHLVCVFELAV